MIAYDVIYVQYTECGVKMYSEELIQLGKIYKQLDLNLFFRSNKDLSQLLKQQTSFLSPSAYARERLWYVEHNTNIIPKCKICDKNVKWSDLKKTHSIYCSSKCAHNDPDVQQKTINTNMEKYGTPYSCLNDDVKSKKQKTDNINKQRKQTTNNNLLSPKEKQKQTLLERYGVDNAFKSKSIQQKAKQTMMDRYGVEHALQNKAILDQVKQTNIDKYGVEYNIISPNNINKRKQTCITRYGQDHFLKNPTNKTIWKDSINDYQQQLMGDEIFIKLRDKDLLTQLYDKDHNLTSISEIIGVSPTTISRWFKRHEIPIQFFKQSYIEQQLVNQLSSIIPTLQISRHNRTIISPYELDIVLEQYKIAIEIDGVYWHSELNGKHKDYHLIKTKLCNDAGYQLIHITDIELKTNPSLVVSRILSKMRIFDKILHGRKTNVEIIPSKECNTFLDDNHIQRSCGSSIKLGLTFNNTLVAVMTFGKPRYNNTSQYELLRYCTKQNTSILGGAQKLFKYFISTYNPSSIISYSDKSWNTGGVYERLGFKYSHTSAPNYYYFHKSDTYKLYHRSSFQKHKLCNKLSKYNPELSEWENMINNGFDRIWDCGNDVWLWDTNKKPT